MTGTGGVPAVRVRRCNELPPAAAGDYVLYWMTAFRRLRSNYALERAAERARQLRRPLLILEALRCDYRWASVRHHRFALDGMVEHAAALAGGPVGYYPYLEPSPGAGSGLLAALAAHAAVVIADDAPVFFLPRMLAAAAPRIALAGVAMEAVDANGLLPLGAAPQTFVTAYHFRRFLQRTLPDHLGQPPAERPLDRRLPPFPRGARGEPRLAPGIVERWPPADLGAPGDIAGVAAVADRLLAPLPIDRRVGAVADTPGGEQAAEAALDAFVGRLAAYGEDRNDPDREATSGLSPYLHWGQISTHQVLAAVAAAERWSPERVARTTSGARAGWWGMSPAAESFLDQAVTWREVGFNMAAMGAGRADAERYESLPPWARATLDRHRADPRPELYDLAQLDAAETHDEVWNAAQRQLVRDGRMHNYLRMLWGKKVLEWSPSPEAALARLIELNNRYALDGRDPNSYSGIFWCFGRYDRPWAPERPIFGVVRYMSSASARRKLHLDRYLARHGPAGGQGNLF